MSNLDELKSYLKYDPNTGDFIWIKYRRGSFGIGEKAGSVNIHYKTGKRYIFIHCFGKQWRAHRLAWLFMTGHECDTQIDHINGDGTDNRWSNLRSVSSQENSKNQRRRFTNVHSDVMGVRLNKPTNSWVASIRCDGKNVHLGLFKDFNKAVQSRKLAEKLLGYHQNHGSNRPL